MADTASASSSSSGGGSNTLDVSLLESLLEEKTWHRPEIWYVDWSLSLQSTAGVTLDKFLGVFSRLPFLMDISAPEPLPTHNASVMDSKDRPLPILVDGNVKQHQTITSLRMRPLGFSLTFVDEPSAIASPPTNLDPQSLCPKLIQDVAASECYRRSCPGPRPSFFGHMWLSRIAGYAHMPTSLRSYFADVLGGELCTQFPQLSFIFGSTRNPVNLILPPSDRVSKKGSPVAAVDSHIPNASHLTGDAVSEYFSKVVMQCWLCVNARFAVQTHSSAIRPQYLFAMDSNDCSDDYKVASLSDVSGTEQMFRQSKDGVGVAFPEKYTYAGDTSTNRHHATLKRVLDPSTGTDETLREAWNLASKARHLTLGRFARLVAEVYIRHTGYKDILTDKYYDNMKMNLETTLSGSGFVLGMATNLLANYKAAMHAAAPQLQRQYIASVAAVSGSSSSASASLSALSPSASTTPAASASTSVSTVVANNNTNAIKRRPTTKEQRSTRPMRPTNETALLNPSKIDSLEYKSKARIPARSTQFIATMDRGGTGISPAPLFFTHRRTTPVRPLVYFDVAFATPMQKSATDPCCYWMLGQFLTSRRIAALDTHLRSKGHVVCAVTENKNAKTYFGNPANEPVATRPHGPRMRYMTFFEGAQEFYVHPSKIHRSSATLLTDPTKNSHTNRRTSAASASSASAVEGLLTLSSSVFKTKKNQRLDAKEAASYVSVREDPLKPTTSIKGILDPSTQCVPTFVDVFSMLMRRYNRATKSGDKAFLEEAKSFESLGNDVAQNYVRLFQHRDTGVLGRTGVGAAEAVSLFDIMMNLLSQHRLSESRMWLVLLISEAAVANRKLAFDDEKAIAQTLSALSTRWSRGLDVLQQRKLAAFDAIGFSENDAQDVNMIRSIFTAFLPENPTYRPECLEGLNHDFHKRFFVPNRLSPFLDSVKFGIYHTAKPGTPDVPVARSIFEEIVVGVSNAVCTKSGLSSALSAELMRHMFDSKGRPKNNLYSRIGDVDGAGTPQQQRHHNYYGVDILRHIMTLFLEKVKHPIFVYAAYVSNPPLGACIQGTGTEWVKPNSDPRSTRPQENLSSGPVSAVPAVVSGVPKTPLRPPRAVPHTPTTPASASTVTARSTAMVSLTTSSNSRDSWPSSVTSGSGGAPAVASLLEPRRPDAVVATTTTTNPEPSYTAPFKDLRDKVFARIKAKMSEHKFRFEEFVTSQNFNDVADLGILLCMSKSCDYVPEKNGKRRRLEESFQMSREQIVRMLVDKEGFAPETLQLRKTLHALPKLPRYTRVFDSLQTLMFPCDAIFARMLEARVDDHPLGEPVSHDSCMQAIAVDLKALCEAKAAFGASFNSYVQSKNTFATAASDVPAALMSFRQPSSYEESIAINILKKTLTLMSRVFT